MRASRGTLVALTSITVLCIAVFLSRSFSTDTPSLRVLTDGTRALLDFPADVDWDVVIGDLSVVELQSLINMATQSAQESHRREADARARTATANEIIARHEAEIAQLHSHYMVVDYFFPSLSSLGKE
jgi:hypothetical protein